MPRRAFLTLVLGVNGNVNADAGVGTRIPVKKIVSWNKEVRVFVSPRCIRRGLRKRLAEKGFKIDPQTLERGNQLTDVGDPIKYVDDDLFGYLAPKKGRGEVQPARSGPVKVSPLIALHHTEISVEFAGRFPRKDIDIESVDANPVPFEIETAQWLGSMHVIISDRVGRFQSDELTPDVEKKIDGEYSGKAKRVSDESVELNRKEREERLKALMEILLKEGWTFPRGSEAVNHPEYHYAILLLSNSFLPMSNILKMTDDLSLDLNGVINTARLYEWEKGYVMDYRNNKLLKLPKDKGKGPEEVELTEGALKEVIRDVVEYLIGSG